MRDKVIFVILVVAAIIVFVGYKYFSGPGDSTVATAGSTPSPVTGNSAATPTINSAAPSPDGFGPVKNVQIFDPMFNMAGYTMQVPTNWEFEGAVLHGPGCMSNYSGTAFRAYSKDMLYGMQMFPSTEFVWADDPRALPKGPGCKDLQPISATDYGKFISIRIRPGSVVDPVEPIPDEAAFEANINNMNQSMAAECAREARMAVRGGLPPACPSYKGDSKLLYLHYDLNGHPEEESLEVQIIVENAPTTIPAPPTARGPSFQSLRRFQIISTVYVSGARAPRGQLKSLLPAYRAMGKTFQIKSDYKAAYSAYMQNKTNQQIAASWQTFHSMMKASDDQMAQVRANAQAQVQQMQAQSDARNAQFNADMAARSGHARDVSDYLLDQQYYVSPTTGQTQTQSNAYNHTFSNGSGPGSAVVQTNDPNFNPNGVIQGNWTELQPIHH
jgi:hypothetical protein